MKHVLVSVGVSAAVTLLGIAMFSHNMLPGFVTGGVVIRDANGNQINPKQ